MTKSAYFSVDTRLTTLLGETYRSTEAALKELVDNAWDADADNVWITLPAPMSKEPIIVKDDGSGMTPLDMSTEYLMIARDRRSKKGQRSPKYKRRIKGRKGIGKFAGLAAAQQMQVITCAAGVRSTVSIDKQVLLEADKDLEQIPLPVNEMPVSEDEHGTSITLSSLSQNMSFPKEEAMRAALIHEYGREHGFSIYVNGSVLTVEDVIGPSRSDERDLPLAGSSRLHFSIAEGKPPKYPGIVLRSGGKVIGGKPMFFGLDEDPEIPPKLLKRVYGEVEVDSLEGHVTSDWGAVFENSELFAEVKAWVHSNVRGALEGVYKNEIDLQKARLKQEISRRLEKLPEHRRAFAENAINRVLQKFFGERPERISTVASVLLDAMERDEYYLVLLKIDEARHADVSTFADALEQFGLLELALISQHATHRLAFLDSIDALVGNNRTHEKEIHKALDNCLWVLGGRYHMMASNRSLRRVVNEYCENKYAGSKGKKRPDLLLATDSADRYLLIEFKRPKHPIDRDDEAQAREYRDELSRHFPGKAIDILLLGGSRAQVDSRYDAPDVRVLSYTDVISQARHELEWLLANLATREP